MVNLDFVVNVSRTSASGGLRSRARMGWRARCSRSWDGQYLTLEVHEQVKMSEVSLERAAIMEQQPEPDLLALRIAERLIQLLNRGGFTATYKYAV